MNKIKFILLLIFISASSFAEESVLKKIYIIQTIAHPALDNTYKGVIDELASEGYIEGKTAEIKFANAQGDALLSNQIAKKFADKKPDVIIAIATLAAQSTVNATKNTDIPVVFASVTDPIQAGVIKKLSNVTGVSNYITIEPQLDLFKKILPNISNLGVIYNPSEANSVKLLTNLKESAKQYNINIVTAVANKTADVSTAAAKLIGNVDAIFINNDNTALAAFPVITKIANNAKTPVFVSDTDMVKKGALAALGPNQYQIGQQTAKMVAQILKGQKAKDIEFCYPDTIELSLNQKVALIIDIKLSNDLIKSAK